MVPHSFQWKRSPGAFTQKHQAMNLLFYWLTELLQHLCAGAELIWTKCPNRSIMDKTFSFNSIQMLIFSWKEWKSQWTPKLNWVHPQGDMNDICFMVIHPIVGHVLHNCASAARCCSCLRWFRYSQDEVKHLTRGDTTRTDQVATEDTPDFVLWGFLKSLRNILAIYPVIIKVFKVF